MGLFIKKKARRLIRGETREKVEMKFSNTVLALLSSTIEATDRCTAVRFGQTDSFPLTSLTSYPGSGNTWVRYLIEEYTGYYTGSIYNDNNLYQGGFQGERADWTEGTTIIIKAHSFVDERNLGDAVLLIRSPFDAILAQFNRMAGIAHTESSGDETNHHTGRATMEDFESDEWINPQHQVGRATRWLQLYEGNLNTRKTPPVFFEDLKVNPVPEMKKSGFFLNPIAHDQAALDCMFGDQSNKFKRAATDGFDPWSMISQTAIERINDKVRQLNETLYQVHGVTLPSSYIRN